MRIICVFLSVFNLNLVCTCRAYILNNLNLYLCLASNPRNNRIEHKKEPYPPTMCGPFHIYALRTMTARLRLGREKYGSLTLGGKVAVAPQEMV